MAVIDKNIISMSMPKAMNRGNPIPLDASAVWYDLGEMQTYATTNPTAYVGQILSLVNEETQQATAYIITNAAGTLQEIGSGVAVDDKTIMLQDGNLALKNWGVQYYKWVEDEEGQSGHHELVTVGPDEPWIAGLEPKSASSSDGQFVLEWYQPSTLTVEGVNSALNSVQTEVTNIKNIVGDSEDTAVDDTVYGKLAGKLDLTGGTLTGDLTLSDGSKAASETVVDTKIASAIGSAGHLKREIVGELPETGAADPDTIYMVLQEVPNGQDKYIEYMFINDAFEIIGDTSVDLEPYMLKIADPTEGALVKQKSDGQLEKMTITEADLTSHLGDDRKHISEEEHTKLTDLANIKTIGTGLSLDPESGALTAIIATDEALGVVKGGENIGIEVDGTMTVKKVTTSALYVPDGEEFILDGGDSTTKNI